MGLPSIVCHSMILHRKCPSHSDPKDSPEARSSMLGSLSADHMPCNTLASRQRQFFHGPLRCWRSWIPVPRLQFPKALHPSVDRRIQLSVPNALHLLKCCRCHRLTPFPNRYGWVSSSLRMKCCLLLCPRNYQLIPLWSSWSNGSCRRQGSVQLGRIRSCSIRLPCQSKEQSTRSRSFVHSLDHTFSCSRHLLTWG